MQYLGHFLKKCGHQELSKKPNLVSSNSSHTDKRPLDGQSRHSKEYLNLTSPSLLPRR